MSHSPATGYFVDWDGKTRSVANPDGPFSCCVVGDDPVVEVVDMEGFVIYEATLHPSIDSIRASGADVDFANSGVNLFF